MSASPAPIHESKAEEPTIVVARTAQDFGPMAVFQKIAAAQDTTPLKVVRDYAGLAFGPGRINFNDYVRLRLFDPAHWEGMDRRTVAGQRCNRDLALVANYRHDWFGLVTDKIASTCYLAAFGLPTIPIIAFFAPHLTLKSAHALRTREELRSFLMRDDIYPLFGKPKDGFQSLGSIAFRRALPERGELERIDGGHVGIDKFVDDIAQNYASGYLFQRFIAPHAQAAVLHGEKLGTARLLTLLEDGEPRIYRASWKIPSGDNLADNYWRKGNLLAKIDPETGKVGRVVCGTGFETQVVTQHPDTGAAFEGVALPLWKDMKTTVLEAARVMRHTPMIGWDIAATAAGPVIVEMNETPDFFLNQFAHGRGVLEADFLAFLEAQKRALKEHETRVKRDVAKL